MVSGISCTRAIRPQPICPILILLLGAFLPNTLAGTILGMPAYIPDAAGAFDEVSIYFLLDIGFFITKIFGWLLMVCIQIPQAFCFFRSYFAIKNSQPVI